MGCILLFFVIKPLKNVCLYVFSQISFVDDDDDDDVCVCVCVCGGWYTNCRAFITSSQFSFHY